MDRKSKIAFGVTGVILLAQSVALGRIFNNINNFVQEAKEKLDNLYQLGVDVQFEDIVENFDQ